MQHETWRTLLPRANLFAAPCENLIRTPNPTTASPFPLLFDLIASVPIGSADPRRQITSGRGALLAHPRLTYWAFPASRQPEEGIFPRRSGCILPAYCLLKAGGGSIVQDVRQTRNRGGILGPTLHEMQWKNRKGRVCHTPYSIAGKFLAELRTVFQLLENYSQSAEPFFNCWKITRKAPNRFSIAGKLLAKRRTAFQLPENYSQRSEALFNRWKITRKAPNRFSMA